MIVAAGFVVLVLSIPLNGFILSLLWSWFAVPLGILPVGTAHAIGIAAIAELITHQPRNVSSLDTAEGFGELVGWQIGHPLIILLLGFICKSFM